MKTLLALAAATALLLCACGGEATQDSLAIEFRTVVAEGGELIDFGDVRLLVGPAHVFQLDYANVELLRTESMLRYGIAAQDQAAFTRYIEAQIGRNVAARMFGDTIALNAIGVAMPVEGLLHLGNRAGAEGRAALLARRLGERSGD